MDDRRIDNLLRIASEIDELERSAFEHSVAPMVHTPQLRVVDREHAHKLRRHRRVWMARTLALAAAAACLGLVVRINLPTPTPGGAPPMPIAKITPPNPLPSNAGRDVAAVPHAAPAEVTRAPQIAILHPPHLPKVVGDASVVLAIFEDAGGVVRCVRWREHDFGDRDMSEIRPGELAAATYGQQCVVGPHRLIAVGLTGPRDQLPSTEEGAQAMAQCIIGGEKPSCDIEPASYNSTSMSCLPHGLRVMVETLAMGKP